MALPNHTLKKYYEYQLKKAQAASVNFDSPIPSAEDIKKLNLNKVLPIEIPGIELNADSQLKLSNDFVQYYQNMPFMEYKTDGLRFYYKNDFYSYADAIVLFCMIRWVQPRQIIEIGSGFSSAVMLDTNEIFFNNSIKHTFIEPHPLRLKQLLKENDNSQIIIKNVQDVPLEFFMRLNENDILFIDSSHVSKVNSDVNYIIHNILPALVNGVYIHFHDIFYPFEYPLEWLLEGRAYNEQYILRAFLQYNNKFEIIFFTNYMMLMYENSMRSRLPLIYKNFGGSLWLRKQL